MEWKLQQILPHGHILWAQEMENWLKDGLGWLKLLEAEDNQEPTGDDGDRALVQHYRLPNDGVWFGYEHQCLESVCKRLLQVRNTKRLARDYDHTHSISPPG